MAARCQSPTEGWEISVNIRKWDMLSLSVKPLKFKSVFFEFLKIFFISFIYLSCIYFVIFLIKKIK